MADLISVANMGVDIVTYRARIGTFKHAFGQNVLTQDVLVDIPSFRRIIIWEMLGVLMIMMTRIETSCVTKCPHEFKNTSHGLKWDHWPVADYVMPLTVHFVLEVIAYSILLTAVLPELYSTHAGISTSRGHNKSRTYTRNDSKINVLRNMSAQTISVFCVVGSVSFIGMLLLMAGVEPNPGPDGAGKNTCESKPTEMEIHSVLERLDLARHFPRKIKLFDVISIGQEDIMPLEGRQEKKLPWILLRKLMFVNENAFCLDDPTAKRAHASDGDFDESSSDEEYGSDKYKESEAKLNYLDVFLLVYQCCCPMLQQLLCQKMFLCKFAVPFMIPSFSDDIPILSLWPLRSLMVETSSVENRMLECNVLDLPTKCVAFCRIGRPRLSKSLLLNIFVSDESSKTFFNYGCQSGNVTKSVCFGYIETFWLLRAGKTIDKFEDATMVLNMRGCVKTFGKKTMTFVSRFVDTISVLIPKSKLIECKADLEYMTSLCSSVIIVIVGSSKKKVTEFISDLSKYATKHKCTVSWISTYDKKEKQLKCEKNIMEEIVEAIKKETHQKKAKSFDTRLKECTDIQICTDEQYEACSYGKTKALEFCQMVNLVAAFPSLKKEVTPVQSTVARDLGKLLKEIRRERDIHQQNLKRKDINQVRENVIRNITEPIKHFLKVFCNDISLEKIEFYLAWLEYYISRTSRHHLSGLKVRHNDAWANFQKQKHSKNDLQKEKNKIREVESEMDAASFSVGNLFREIGLIYDNVWYLKTDTRKLNIPSMEHIVSVVGKLMANGRQLELIDGDSFYLQQKWLSQIFDSLDTEIRSSKIMTISVLGIQSSGKSTLLNTMFGALFSTSAGRCTRGMHAQLIPLHADFVSQQQTEYQYILILDTEGLRPIEVTYENHEHDNELATLIAGLGNITIVNVMGENTEGIKDILQIVAHAFLRIKLANKHIMLRNRCALVQQNITAITAKANLNDGLNKFVLGLDEMTQDSARCEGVEDIRTFSQVIDFDVSSDVWYLTNVWHGDPPFARVNRNYSETASQIKLNLFKQVSEVQKTTYTPLPTFIDRTNDLWHGVLNENFIFSFKNSMERRAYLKMDEFIHEKLWNIEFFLTKETYTIAQKEFSNCHTLEEIKTCETLVNEKNRSIIIDKTIEADKVFEEYFGECDHRNIIVQWKENQQGRITRFFDKIKGICDVIIRNEREKIRGNLQLQSSKKTNEEALKQKTLDYAKSKSVKNISEREITKLFEDLWAESFGSLNPSDETDEFNIKECFYNLLFDMNTRQHHILRDYLKEVNWDGNTNVKSLKRLIFENTGIDDDDISRTLYVRIKKKVFDYGKEEHAVKEFVQSLYEDITKKIETLCKENEKISESHIRKLLRFIHEQYVTKHPGDIKVTFREKFYVKLDVYISMVANFIFEEHNQNYQQKKRQIYESCKRQQMLLFQSYLDVRKDEDTVAGLITEIIHRHIESESVVQLSHQIQRVLHGKLPANKNRLIIEICDELVDANDFKRILSYIKSPFETAEMWFEHKANSILFDENSKQFFKCSQPIVDNFFSNVTDSLNSLKGDGEVMTTTNDLVSRLRLNLRDNQISIPETDFGSVRMFGQTAKIDLTAVCKAVDSKLKLLIDQPQKLFASYTKDTFRWKQHCPVQTMFKHVWGCCKLCPYCNEPCEKSTESHTEDHTCVQHRPECCNGTRRSKSEQAISSTCDYSIHIDGRHTCGVFKYRCYDGKSYCDKKVHKYREYRTFFKDWHIQPNSDMYDSSKFWLWFVGKFKYKLAKRFGYKIDNIPDSWSHISSADAKDSLRTTYRN